MFKSANVWEYKCVRVWGLVSMSEVCVWEHVSKLVYKCECKLVNIWAIMDLNQWVIEYVTNWVWKFVNMQYWYMQATAAFCGILVNENTTLPKLE